MHYLDESHILLFLIQVLVLLGAARTFGAICEEFKAPALAGEILAGVLLGPTLLGRLSPSLQGMLFPPDATQWTMLETVSWLGVFFLLLASGVHVDARESLKQGRAAISVGIVGVLVPIGIGLPVFAMLDQGYWGPRADRISFALFLAVAGSITAISVVARVIEDTGLRAEPDGDLALSACAVNDIFGWLLFTVVISLATSQSIEPTEVAMTFLGVLGFVGICLLVGSRVVDRAARWVLSTSLSQPAALQTLVVSVGLLCGAITQWLGIHAILGFFLAGSMAGSAPSIDDELHESIAETLHAVFVPLFFATLGIKIDFLEGLQWKITLLFFVVALGGKFVGAWLGARLARQPNRSAVLMGTLFTPGGAMEIVVGTLALELGLINESVFVAIVFAALLSSILVGPLLAWVLRRRGEDQAEASDTEQGTKGNKKSQPNPSDNESQAHRF